MIEILLSQSHVNVNSCGLLYYSAGIVHFCTPLVIAMYSGKEKLVELFLEREELDVNLSGDDTDSPLDIAVKHGYGNVVGLLLKRKDTDINSRIRVGRIPPAYSAKYAFVMKLFKVKEIQADLRDYHDLSPLNYASKFGQERDFKALLSRIEVDVNSRDIYGRTPLLNVASNGSRAMVKLLLSYPNIKVTLTDRSGKNALHIAAKQGHTSNAELLISHSDVDVNLRDSNNKTALHYAI